MFFRNHWLFTTLVLSATFSLSTAVVTRADDAKPAQLPATGIVADAGRISEPIASSCICFGQPCCQPLGPRIFVAGEYLLWKIQDSPTPVPLVTAAPAALIPVGNVKAGSLADPNAAVILGGGNIDTDWRHGARFTVGVWLDNQQRMGVEGNYFFIAPRTIATAASTDGSANTPLLSIPFFDVTGQTVPNGLPGESARPILSPPLFSRDFPAGIPGETRAAFLQRLESRLQGCELNGVFALTPNPIRSGFRLEAIGGFRFLSLRESLGFTVVQNAEPIGAPDYTLTTSDQFTTRNDFYGGQVGLRGEYRLHRIVLQGSAKLAIGDVRQQVTIAGATVTNLVTGPGTTSTNYTGGIFAQPSDMGVHSRDVFALLPQFEANVGYQIFDWARVFVGYSFLDLGSVARPGNEINRFLNVTRMPVNTDPNGAALVPTGLLQPAHYFRDASFWAQGLNVGLELRY